MIIPCFLINPPFIFLLFSDLCSLPNELTAFWLFNLLLLLSSDIHPNPGPLNGNDFSSGFLSFCNWNLNSLAKDNFYRTTLLNAHNAVHKYDIISLCETSLNDETPIPENAIPGYIYHPWNHPSGARHGGVGPFLQRIPAIENTL